MGRFPAVSRKVENKTHLLTKEEFTSRGSNRRLCSGANRQPRRAHRPVAHCPHPSPATGVGVGILNRGQRPAWICICRGLGHLLLAARHPRNDGELFPCPPTCHRSISSCMLFRTTKFSCCMVLERYTERITSCARSMKLMKRIRFCRRQEFSYAATSILWH